MWIRVIVVLECFVVEGGQIKTEYFLNQKKINLNALLGVCFFSWLFRARKKSDKVRHRRHVLGADSTGIVHLLGCILVLDSGGQHSFAGYHHQQRGSR